MIDKVYLENLGFKNKREYYKYLITNYELGGNIRFIELSLAKLSAIEMESFRSCLELSKDDITDYSELYKILDNLKKK